MRDILKEKHPECQAPHPDTLLPEDPRANIDPHPVLFEQLNGDLIRATALRTQGSAQGHRQSTRTAGGDFVPPSNLHHRTFAMH